MGKDLLPLLGVVIGGFLTIASNVILEYFRAARRAEQLSHAIAGEVAAVLSIVEMRQYLPGVQERAKLGRQGQWIALEINVKRDYFPTIQANLDSIGLLPAELPLLVPRFLTFANSALEDFEKLSGLNPQTCSVADLTSLYDELAVVLTETIAAGTRVVTTVATIYGSPHNR